MTMTVGLILAFALVLAVGNFIAAKPKPVEIWLDDWRMQARLLKLQPKLAAAPTWLSTTYATMSQATPMLAQYIITDDNWQLPAAVFVAQDNRWYGLGQPDMGEYRHTAQLTQKSTRLEGVAIDLGQCNAFVKALIIKANSIAIIIDDENFAHHTAKHLDKHAKQQLLLTIKTQLISWATMVNQP